MNYETIKELAASEGVKVSDLIALAPQNDPFYVGRPAEVEAATWFANWWAKFGYSTGIHLRRIHYRMVSQSPVAIMPNGKPYENTMECWGYLNNASKWARYLELVDAAAFVDRRNPDAVINANYNYEDNQLTYGLNETSYADYFPTIGEIVLPELSPNLPDFAGFDVAGYEWLLDPVHVEVWCEKTTMNDILGPLCKNYYTNLVTGAGELSITATLQFMERVATANRPARIIYISDFDPAGLGMPISIARKIEYWQHQEDSYRYLDIRLEPVVLTVDQVRQYGLPRIPVKESDKRKDNWAKDFGDGAVELDALEALHPGQLRRIVSQAITRYRDSDYHDQANELHEQLEHDLDRERQAILADYEPTITALTNDYKNVLAELEQVRQAISATVEQFNPALTALAERLETIAQEGNELNIEIADRLNRIHIDLDDYALPVADVDDPEDALFDSRRSYLDQLSVYKSYRHTGETMGVNQ